MSSSNSSVKRVAIVYGGNSNEYEVSVKSASVIIKHIDKEKYDPYPVRIKASKWICETGARNIEVDKSSMSFLKAGRRLRFDVVFNIIHGTPGEDGLLQGVLDMDGVPYTSAGMLTSALTFNKWMCSRLVSTTKVVNIADSLLIRRGSKIDTEKIISEISIPCFVKPNKGGSSLGISKVKRSDELDNAINLAFEQDDEVLIESFIDGTEVTCGIFEMNNDIIVLPLTEIVPKTEYFDYDAKYKGKSDEITPARINIEDENEIKRVSSILYKYLDCKGLVRFDYILSDKGLFFLEVNTVPGMSEESIVPQQLNYHGISLKEFITIVIEQALICK